MIQLSGIKLPKGRAGVAILWPESWAKCVKRLPDGNERIIAIEISGAKPVCLVNTYMPTNNSAVSSHEEYQECLDIIHTMIAKYGQTHEVIVCGDMDGTLLPARDYNRHDKLLQSFC